jgi:hypothetical protein
VHFGTATQIRAQRAETLTAAYECRSGHQVPLPRGGSVDQAMACSIVTVVAPTLLGS